MEENIKEIEIEVSINHDINEASFILAPKSAQNMNEIYAAHLEEKIGNEIKKYKEDVECALDIVRNSEKKIKEFEVSIEESEDRCLNAEKKSEEALSSLDNYAKKTFENITDEAHAKFVNTSGDTMSGNLEFVDNKSIYLYNQSLAIEDTPESTYFGLMAGYADKNKARKSYIESYWKPDGSRGICISEKKNSTENSYAQLLLGFDTEGQAFATAPASDNYEAIVTTLGINKASNGYVKLGNGIILQWGVATAPENSTSVTVTLPISFSNTNYKVVANANAGSGYAVTHGCIFVQVTSASQFKLSHQNPYSGSALSRWWFAIGY